MCREGLRFSAIALLIVVALSIPTLFADGEATKFYIYGLRTCPHCHKLYDILSKNFGVDNVYMCYIKEHRDCYQRLWDFYKIIGFEPVVPLTIVIRDGVAKAIVVGEVDDVNFWRSVASASSTNVSAVNKVPVYVGKELYGYIVLRNRGELINFTKSMAPQFFNTTSSGIAFVGRFVKVGHAGRAEVTRLESLLTLLPETVLLALSDSINPCALYIYVVLLIAAALSVYGEKRAIMRHVTSIGLSFVVAVYIGYMLLGLGLLKAVSVLPLYAPIASAIAIGFGAWTIATGVLRKSRSIAKGFVLERIPRASLSIPLSFALGLLVTFTLLPCSAGPYLLFVTIAKRAGLTMAELLPLLAIYNTVFVSPMIAILLFMSSISKLESVQRFIVSRGDVLSIFSGLLLTALGIYVLLTYG